MPSMCALLTCVGVRARCCCTSGDDNGDAGGVILELTDAGEPMAGDLDLMGDLRGDEGGERVEITNFRRRLESACRARLSLCIRRIN